MAATPSQQPPPRPDDSSSATSPGSSLPQSLPRPDQSYERANPDAEAGMGDLDKEQHTPTDRDDQHQHAAAQHPDGTKLKTDCSDNLGRPSQPVVREKDIQGDMKTEEPLGWDQAPQKIDDPRQKRHPRPDGVGGSEKRD